MAVAVQEYNYCTVTVNGDTVLVNAYDNLDRKIDEFTVAKGRFGRSDIYSSASGATIPSIKAAPLSPQPTTRRTSSLSRTKSSMQQTSRASRHEINRDSPYLMVCNGSATNGLGFQ